MVILTFPSRYAMHANSSFSASNYNLGLNVFVYDENPEGRVHSTGEREKKKVFLSFPARP